MQSVYDQWQCGGGRATTGRRRFSNTMIDGNIITLHRLNPNYKDVTVKVAEIEWAYRIYESRRKR